MLLVGSTVVWGGLHPLAKVLMREGLTPAHIALCRMSFCALTMLAVALASGRLPRLRQVPAWDLVRIAAIGLSGYFVSIFFSLKGLAFLPAATNSLLANTSPLFVVVLMPLLLRERPSPRAVAGLVAGFTGVAVLTQSGGVVGAETPWIGVIFSLIAAATWALYTALGRWSAGRLDAVLVTMVSSAVSVPPLLTVAVSEGQLDKLIGASPLAWVGLIWLGVVATGVAFVVWTSALRRLPAASVSAFGYLIPLFSVLFSYLLLGEQPTPLFVAGALLVMLGVATAQR